MQTDSFQHLNLDEIDPEFTPIDEDRYDLQIQEMKLVTFVYKSGVNQGKEGERIAVRLVVVNHDEFSGRTLFEAIWPREGGFKSLRRIMDATGIQQSGDLESWLAEVSSTNPVVNVLIKKVPDYRDPTVEVNQVSWNEVSPATA